MTLVKSTESGIWKKTKTKETIVRTKCTCGCLHRGSGLKQHNAWFASGILYKCSTRSLCWVTNYINHPQEICEDVFATMQLHRRGRCTLSIQHPSIQRDTPCILFAGSNRTFAADCLYNLCLNRKRKKNLCVQFLPPAALEASHTCSQSWKAIHSILLLRDLNNIRNSN